MSRLGLFRTIKSAKPLKVNGHAKNWTEAEIVAAARQVLDEHKAAREAAIKAHNLVCGNCQGSGNTPSTLMPGELVKCFACEGSGKPNDAVQAVPELTADDNERLWKLRRLVSGPYGASVMAVVREYFPDMYASPAESQAVN